VHTCNRSEQSSRCWHPHRPHLYHVSHLLVLRLPRHFLPQHGELSSRI